MYATAAIPQYWIVNLRQNIVEVYDQPELVEARYLKHQVFVFLQLAFPCN